MIGLKILYFGTVCDLSNYEKTISECVEKPTIAPIIFESSLLTGLKEIGADVDIYSFPMIPSFPHLKKLWWGSKRESLACGYDCTWLKTVNLPFLKQISRRLDTRHIIKKWIRKNRDSDCAIVTYSIPPFCVKDIIHYSKKYNVKCFAIVTDLLSDMYIISDGGSLLTKLRQTYVNQAIRYQGSYDGYIYLTKAMSEVINPQKPYLVVEGIADISNVKAPVLAQKAVPQAVMYAGVLHEKYGTINLIKAFMQMKRSDVELWLFGDGNCLDQIEEYSKKDSRIKFFGRVSRSEVLEYERRASLLINVRSTSDEYTKYSFPSKTIEYMLSGTPMLTTRLQGIPEDYYAYLFSINDNLPDSITAGLQNVFSKTAEERNEFGHRAQKYIVSNKNPKDVAQKLYCFLKDNI